MSVVSRQTSSDEDLWFGSDIAFVLVAGQRHHLVRKVLPGAASDASTALLIVSNPL